MIRRALLIAALACASCAASAGASRSAPAPELGDPVQFSFGTLDGEVLSSDSTRGRTTVLLFVTTYDLPSQAQAQILRNVAHSHRPRANVAVVMLEPPQSAPLAQVWRDSMRLDLPVAMASPSLLAGESAFGRVTGVPTLLVLDRRGRLTARREGSVSAGEIRAYLRQADSR